MNKRQVEAEIEWLKTQLASKKLTKKNIIEYQRRIRRKEIEIAFMVGST